MSYSVPPASYPQPPRPPRRSHRTLIIVLVVVLVVCCGGAATGGFLLFRGVLGATAPPRDATHAFLADLQTDNHSGAYEQLCRRAQQNFSLNDFTRHAESFGEVVDYRITGVSMQRNLGGTTGSVTTRLSLADGNTRQHTFPLVSEDGQWRVCGTPF